MIHSYSLNKNLWAEAVNTAVYVLNRTGTSTVKDKTPYECWFEKPANVDNFKVFGSVVYSHVPKQKRKKFDKKTTKCVFVGYGDHSNVFRVYNPERRAVETVRDVIFGKSEHTKSEMTQAESNDVVVNVSLDRNLWHENNVVQENNSNIQISETNEILNNSLQNAVSEDEQISNESVSSVNNSMDSVNSLNTSGDQTENDESNSSSDSNGLVDRISGSITRDGHALY